MITQANEQDGTLPEQDSRKLWVEAVEKMAENAELRKRIEFLERELAVNSFAGWQVH